MNNKTKKFYIETRDGLDMIFHDDIDAARQEFNADPHNKSIMCEVVKIWEAR
jgi:hypothetical protein